MGSLLKIKVISCSWNKNIASVYLTAESIGYNIHQSIESHPEEYARILGH